MADLISRDDYREIFDEQLRHYDDGTNPFHMQILKLQREILDDMPAVDAVPVEWLNKKRDSETLALFSNIYGRGDKDIVHSIHKVLELWRKEHEEQNG